MLKTIKPDNHRKSTIDWSNVFGKMGGIIRALLDGLLRLLMLPLRVGAWVFNYNTRQASARSAEKAADNGNDRVADIERDLEQRVAEKKANAPARRRARRQALTTVLNQVSEGKPVDVLSLGLLDSVASDWLQHLTPDQAAIALTHPIDEIAMHLRGDLAIPGLPPRMTHDQEQRMRAEDEEARRQYRFPTYGRRAMPVTYDDVSDERVIAF